MKTKKKTEYLSPTIGVLPLKMEQVICWSAQSSTTDEFIIEDEDENLF